MRYLDRYPTSAGNLRRALLRKVDRNLAICEGDRDVCVGWVDALVAQLVEAGVVDDRVFAASRARSLQRRGNSTRVIALKLREKGVPGSIIQTTLADLSRELGSPDRFAAVTYARKRRMGPFAPDPAARSPRKQKDLAAFARRGFSYAVAIRVLEAETIEELEIWATSVPENR